MSVDEDLGIVPGSYFSGYEMTLIMHGKEQGETEERNRCLSILKSIEPMNPSEAHLIEIIVRRMRGDE